MPQKWNVEKICKTCHKIFYARKHDVSCGRGIYCSWLCRAKDKKTRVNRICKFCGKNFEVKVGIIKDGFGKFCSKDCYLSSYRNPIKKCKDCSTIIDNRAVRCVECDRKLFVSPTLGKGHSIEVREKLSKFRKNRKSPETSDSNHWNWRGGITLKSLKIRKSIEYRLWREAVFARDGWTCKSCHIKGGYIEAHHIKKFSKYPELRLAIDNGMTLCKKCHNKTKEGARCQP